VRHQIEHIQRQLGRIGEGVQRRHVESVTTSHDCGTGGAGSEQTFLWSFRSRRKTQQHVHADKATVVYSGGDLGCPPPSRFSGKRLCETVRARHPGWQICEPENVGSTS
jgi:hypothetical protein